jgi:RNA polymerase sigma-70 factor (ECF subfamily)
MVTAPGDDSGMDPDPLRLFLVERGQLLGYLGVLLPADLVEDCFQDCFLVVQRQAERYDPQRDFSAWLRGIARLEAKRLLRQRRRLRSLPSEEVLSAIDAACSDSDLDEDLAEEHARLAACLDRLQPRHRELLDRRYREGLSLAELAAAAKSSSGAVQVMLSRIRSTLQDCVRRAVGGVNP